MRDLYVHYLISLEQSSLLIDGLAQDPIRTHTQTTILHLNHIGYFAAAASFGQLCR